MTGDIDGAVAQLCEVVVEAEAAHDGYWRCCALFMQAFMLAYHGDPSAARDAANSAVEVSAELGGFFPGLAYAGLTVATLAAGDVARPTMRSRRACPISVSSPSRRRSGLLTRPRPRWRAGI
jgi:hypothetical protein